MARPLVEFRYPLRPGATAPTLRVSIGQFNEFMSIAGAPHAASYSPAPGPASGPAGGPTGGSAPGPTSGPTPGPTPGPASGPAPGPTSGPTYSPDKPSDLDADSGLAIRQLAHSPLVPSQSHPGLGLLTSVLREFLNDNQASFRSVEQRDAFYLIMKRTPYFFLILPTAAGKTTLFLLGASLFTHQVTILIIPLISLKLDLYKKAKALGLEPTV
ncbi:hypothetical protein F1880_007965 [Penicillium rolfsii]|nr:hypothetical protein F1880_007965 [Penicillium rolfsii]